MKKDLRKQYPKEPKFLLALWFILILLGSCSYRKYDGLLTWEEYKKNSARETYILELVTEKGSLVYYGSIHSVDPRDPQFVDIEKRWRRFRPTKVLCEGCIWPLEDSRKRAIRQYGEGGLVRFLAARNGIPIKCIDPPRSREIFYLSHFFTPERVKLYYILRQAVVNRNLKKDIKDVNYARNILDELIRFRRYEGNPNTFHEFESTVYKVFPELESWQSIPAFYFYSNNPENFLPRIHRKLNEYRDHHMIKTLIKELKKGERVFAVVGRSHVVKQEPVLRSELSAF
ncbi:MAG: hypothetical protein JSV96_02660 [Candidatus Aminicenantes bacterium]|nr:MAG: hypothetical protein JSV96_02660 [Candidatus Aminicenantes bacterium]